MDTRDAGRLGGLKGGKSRSPAKREAARKNAAKALARRMELASFRAALGMEEKP